MVFFIILVTMPLPSSIQLNASEQDKVNFTILHTNDEHSALIPRGPAIDYHPEKKDPTRGGLSRLATAVNNLEAQKEDEEVILINAGDFMGGTMYNWLALEGYAPELNLMQDIGYDIVALGNHEFDLGPDVLADYLEAAGYPKASTKTTLMGTNIDIPNHHPLANKEIENLHVKKIEDGPKIGFFSLIGYDAINVVVESGPVEFSDPLDTARTSVEKLKDEKNVDLVIGVTHSGIEEDREMAEKIDGIDAIVGGHSHTEMEEPELINDTIIVQAGELIEHLGILELSYFPHNGELKIRNEKTGTPHLLPVDDHIEKDPSINKSLEKYTNKLETMIYEITDGAFSDILEPVGTSDFTLANRPYDQENQFGNFIADAMRLITEEKTGKEVDCAAQGSGIIRNEIVPGTMEHSRGKISLYDLTEAVALGSSPENTPGFPLASVYLTGEEIRRIMEISTLASQYYGSNYFLQVSGVRFTYDPDRVILFQIPGIDLPYPSLRSVTNAEIYTGTGLQPPESEDYTPLQRGDDELYHVVTDYTLIENAVPRVEEEAPWLNINPKDKKGNLIEDPEDTLLRHNGEILSVWQAVLEYMDQQPEGPDSNPQVKPYYQETTNRIVEQDNTGILMWPVLFLGLIYTVAPWLLLIFLGLIVIMGIIIKRRRQYKKNTPINLP